MHTFFAPDLNENTSFVELNKEEAHHALQVLRLKEDDEIVLFNGSGIKASARLVPSGKRKAGAEVITLEKIKKTEPRLSICLGLIKNRTRLEWACEKLTETGVNDIILLETERTERSKFRTDRIEGILLSAAKQSLSAWLPELSHQPLDSFLTEKKLGSADTVFILAHEKQITNESGPKTSFEFPDLRDEIIKAGFKHICIFVGPEGGFSEDEVSRILSLSCSYPLWLGEQRLRAETAAVQLAGLFRFAL